MKLLKIFNKSKVIFYHQLESTDCGAACLAMIMSYYGNRSSLSSVKALFEFTRLGISVQDILDVSEKVGLYSVALKLTLTELEEIPLPCILYWKQSHFVVIKKIGKKNKQTFYHILDPGYGKIILEQEVFETEWKGNSEKGVAIYLEPTENFAIGKKKDKEEKGLINSNIFKFSISFIKKNKSKYIISFILIVLGLVTNWFIPFTFQKIIDIGILSKSISVVYYLLLAQFILFISNFLSDFINQLILTKSNFLLTINLKRALLNKLLKLPLNFFDTKINTEILQRLNDQNTIQNFITWKGINLILILFNILVFGGILFYFNRFIFFVYLVLSILSILWVLIFLKRRRINEYAIFLKQTENSNNIYEFIMNMPEIKINGAQNNIINKILYIQDKSNKLELRSLFLNTYQLVGMNIFSKLKEIIAIGYCAILIIEGKMTLGVLLSISYIIGQLTGPIQNIISFIRDVQDVNIANKRIELLYDTPNEDDTNKIEIKNYNIKNINVNSVSFKYPGSYNPFILENVSFNIPKNSVTAIVGASGSGKTTLLKLLLSYYPVKQGGIYLDDYSINEINAEDWRDKCGTVLQNGNIFSDTIASNISMSMEDCNIDQLREAAKIAGIQDFIEQLPMHYFTRIGNSGIELSGGQKQRILIARAVYKNPNYLFFDEATSALDSENEKIIHDNLQEFFKGRTVVIIAHRLSTVKNADQIIVLKNGQIAEVGNHNRLVKAKSEYYNLVKNQLELGA
ncbi:MAG: peptidase domain-containing ABC transporter [Apibacter sp.]|nr:peptidase domain-containing ABC transporter [Apibacter sp.]